MEIGDGKKLFLPCLEPLFFLEKLALRAVPVPAGVVGYLYMTAVFARIEVSPQLRGPADLDGAHGAELIEGEFMSLSI